MTTTNPAMPQILIISNDSDSSQSLQQALGPDYQLQLVQSAQQAWSSVNDSLPDLVVVDVVLPDSDAFELCRSLKNDLRLQLTPVVLAGDAASAETQQYALDQGAVDYLNKPFDLPLLKARLRTHIQLKQKIDLLEDLAMLDGLTGLANRQRMDIALQQEWRRAARNDAPLSVVMADVDHLQQYNDHYGHAKGDQVLQQIADIMQQCLQRPGDLVARLDGGKFVAILQNTDSEGAWLVAEQFRSMLEEANIEHQPSSLGCCITLSAGCASVLPSEDENAAAELLQQAEDLLQQAKQGGRNQVRS